MLVETVLSMLTLVCHLKKVVASGLGIFSGAFGIHHGGLQCAGPVARPRALRVGLRASLHR